MNTKQKTILIPILILGLGLSAFGQMGPGPGERMGGKGMPPAELNLSDEQQTQMRDLKFAHEKVMIGLQADLKTERLELKKLKLADEPNKKKIMSQIEKVGSIEIAKEKARAEHQLEVRKVLNDEQLKIFRKHQFDRKGRHDGPRKERPHRRGPDCP